MSKAAYNKAIVDTFRVNALRTAHIIDDSFPTYEELAANDDAKKERGEWKLAAELYAHFRANHIPCDVANTIDSLEDDVNRIRKSDLIVLDYNLTPATPGCRWGLCANWRGRLTSIRSSSIRPRNSSTPSG